MPTAKANSNRERPEPTTPGVIEPQCLYTVEEARRRLRLGDWAWRQMRRDGLVVLRVAGRAYVRGNDVISYVETKGRATS
jgi:hypothetical protein